MTTQDIILAAFIATLNVPVRKVAADTFEFDLEETNPLVEQYSAPDGYNVNVHKLSVQLEELSQAEIYVAPEPAPEQTNEEEITQ